MRVLRLAVSSSFNEGMSDEMCLNAARQMVSEIEKIFTRKYAITFVGKPAIQGDIAVVRIPEGFEKKARESNQSTVSPSAESGDKGA